MSIPTFTTLSQSIINNILTVNPAIDVKIGEAVRDLFIDPQASMLQQLYSTVDYSSLAQSVLTATGAQLDRLAYNYYITRLPATRATGSVTLVISNGLSAPTLLNIGDQFYTALDQTGTIYTFICAQATLLPEGTVQATIPILALNTGSSSNVAANTITQSNYDFVDSLYNSEATSGGTDAETDAAFAARIPTFVTGTYTNTFNGVTKIIYDVENLVDNVNIITPGSPLSRGPYTVDVYLQRQPSYFGTVVTETAPANQQIYQFLQQPLYELNPLNEISSIDPATNTQVTYPSSSYEVVTSLTDLINLTNGSTRATSVLQWLTTPPAQPYTISYNVDQTVIDAQNDYDAFNEIVADVLFRQARAIPIFISAIVQTRSTATALTTVTNFDTNLTSQLFSQLGINTTLNSSNVIYVALQDSNVSNIQLTCLDSTYGIELTGTQNSSGGWTFNVTGPSTNALLDHSISPLGIYWEDNPAPSPYQPFAPAGRLFIGDPLRITLEGPPDFSAGVGNGVKSATMINNVAASWTQLSTADPYYDSRTQTLMIDFPVAPVVVNGVAPTITFTIVQPSITPPGGPNYIALAPSLVQPIIAFPGQSTLLQPLYGTIVPYGLNPILAKVYKNGVSLTNGIDYTITGPDANGVYTITFTTQPLSTDILEYGLQNPDISISSSS